MATIKENGGSLCIFCLKTIADSPDDCKSDHYGFFTLFFRHCLCYSVLTSANNQEWSKNACKLIHETTINCDDNSPFFKNGKICNNCEEITRKFSDLYYQMIELELRVDLEVGKIWDVIGCADKVASSLENASTFGWGGMTLAKLRKTLKRSCEVYQDIKKKLIEEESLLNGCKDSSVYNIPEFLSPISMEEFRILYPNVLEYPTQPDDEGYNLQPGPEVYIQRETLAEGVRSPALPQSTRTGSPTKLEVENQQETSAEELVVEHNEEQKMDERSPIYSQVVVVNRELDLVDLSPLPVSSLSTAAFVSQVDEEDPLNPPTNSNSTYICTTSTCSIPFTSKLVLFQHNMANHIAKYFSSVQLSALSNEQFTNCITHMLETTLDTFENVDENYTCLLCSDQLSGKQKARNHLVVKHRQNLKEKLVELQKSEIEPLHTSQDVENSKSIADGKSNATLKRKRVRKRKRWNSKSKRAKSDFHCAPCSLYFTDRWKLLQHDTFNHPENNFISVKLEFLTLHQFQNCVAHMLTTIVDELQIVNSKYQCTFCSQLLSDKQTAKKHLVWKHVSVLKEKLVQLQNSSDVKLILNTSRRTNLKPSFCVRNNNTSHHTCNICQKDLKSGTLLNKHQMRVHPEIFFESSKLHAFLSGNDEQFKIYVRFVLEQQIKLTDLTKVKAECGICSQVSRDRQAVKIHLISRHLVFLAEKLEDLISSGKTIKNELLKIRRAKLIQKKPSQETESDFHTTLVEQHNSGSAPLSNSQSVCNICGKVYKTGHGLNRHQTQHHPEIYFQNVKPTEFKNDIEGDQVFSKFVLFMLERQLDQEFSKIKILTLPEMEPLEGSPASTPGRRDAIKYKCNFCLKALYNRQFAITHLIVMHQTDMAEKILGGLGGKSVEEIKLEMMNLKKKSTDGDGHKSLFSFECSDVTTTTTSTPMKRKGWPKGKKRLFKKPLLDCDVEC